MKIIVFGKDGQLGKAFQKVLAITPFSKIAEIQFVGRSDVDLADQEGIRRILNAFSPSIIINAAAYTAVDKAEDEVDIAYAVNAKAPEEMAQYAVKNNAMFLHYSTDYVFDGKKQGLYVERDQRNPLGEYGRSKAAGELAIEAVFQKSTSGRFAIFRTSWVYGEGANFIRTILRLAKERDQLRVIADQYGVPTNADWLARVSVNFLFDLSLQLLPLPSGAYRVVPNGETTWYGLANLAIKSALDQGIALKAKPEQISPILAVEYPLPAPRPQNSRLSNAKIHFLIEQQNDVTKLEHLNCPWEESVRQYVFQLARDGLI